MKMVGGDRLQWMQKGIRSVPLLVLLLLAVCSRSYTTAEVIQITASNMEDVFARHEFVMINFYADWCRFSQILKPVYEETANVVKGQFPDESKVALAKVDCDSEPSVASKFHVSKYPTIKMVRSGEVVKKEYRGQRTSDAISKFVAEQMKDPIVHLDHIDEINKLDLKKGHVIGLYDSMSSADYSTFYKVASKLRDECSFYLAAGEASDSERPNGNQVTFRASSGADDQLYRGNMRDDHQMADWLKELCTPIVREITFENAEELTEEGLPFMILFHDPKDTEVVEKFKNLVKRELMAEKSGINFLTADGNKFSHPLFHLGKTTNDLPILAIDSFRHMYLFKHDVSTNLETSGLVKQFIADLHSGKLHREFHHGPDPTDNQIGQKNADSTGHIPHDKDENKPAQPTTPPESTFKKLAPSHNRYTILKDEL